MKKTPVSLLERVRQQSDQEAWGRFVQLYTPLLFHWARRCGLQPDDAADLTQDVFVTLFQKLPEFAYDQHKSFRAWLRLVTLNHWCDRQRRAGTRPLPGDGQLDALTDNWACQWHGSWYNNWEVFLVLREFPCLKTVFWAECVCLAAMPVC